MDFGGRLIYLVCLVLAFISDHVYWTCQKVIAIINNHNRPFSLPLKVSLFYKK